MLVQTNKEKSDNEKFCADCGKQINIKAEICPFCGVRQTSGKKKYDRRIAILFALFLGGFGVHRFYLGNTIAALFYILFCWTFIPALIAFVEAVYWCCMSDDTFDNDHKQ